MFKHIRLGFLILVFIVTMPGCSVLEYIWLVPRANGEVSFNPIFSNTEVLDAFAQVALPELKSISQPSETYRNVGKGVIEIGYYHEAGILEASIAGFSAQAEIDRKRHILTFVIKGAEPYYMPLPVDETVQKITIKLSQKLGKR